VREVRQLGSSLAVAGFPMSNYVTNQEIREQAGFQYKERSEALGTGDGVTVVFYVDNKPIVDKDYSGDVGTPEAVIYIEDVAGLSTPSAIEAALGKITLGAAPATAVAITVDYDWSNVEESLITLYANEAHSLVIAALSEVYTLPLSETPDLIKLIEKKLAAGLLLDKEYSAGGDGTEDTRGRRWIKWAEEKLKQIVEGTLELVDSSGVVIDQKSGAGIDGWPDENTKDESEEDSGGDIKFRIKKQF